MHNGGTISGNSPHDSAPDRVAAPTPFLYWAGGNAFIRPSMGSQRAFAFTVEEYSTSNKWVFSSQLITQHSDFPGSLVLKTLPYNARSVDLIPSWRAKILHTSRPENPENLKQKQYCHKFNKDFKNGLHQGFPGGSVVKNLTTNAGNRGWISDPGRSHMLQSS